MSEKLFLFYFCYLFCAGVSAQNEDPGRLLLISDPRIDSLLQTHIAANINDPRIPGWRVQIFFESGNNSKILAQEAMEEFRDEYPEVEPYISFRPPYYKVRVGDFRTRMDAEKFLDDIRNDYPNAFVTRDNIRYPALQGSD